MTDPVRSDEVERILAAAVRVMERVAPEAPRVSDIVAEAGSSNKAFYRYFAGKDELILAVLERRVSHLVSYLERQMADESEPAAKIARWIEGAMAQVTDPHLISMGRTAVGQISVTETRRIADSGVMAPMRALITEPVAALGGSPEDVDIVFLCTTGTMRRYFGSGQRPDDADVAHLVAFCLAGLRA